MFSVPLLEQVGKEQKERLKTKTTSETKGMMWTLSESGVNPDQDRVPSHDGAGMEDRCEDRCEDRVAARRHFPVAAVTQ